MNTVTVEVYWYFNTGHEFCVEVDTDICYTKELSSDDYATCALAFLFRHLSDVGIDFHNVHFRIGRAFYRDSKNDVHALA